MILNIRLSQLLIGFFCMLFGHSTAQNIIPANVSFGNPTQGGLNGKIIRVTTLDSEGPGSIKEAIETKGPRVVLSLIHI